MTHKQPREIHHPLPKKKNPQALPSSNEVKKRKEITKTKEDKHLTLSDVLSEKKKKGTKKTHFEKTPYFRFKEKTYEAKRALGVDQGYANCGFSVIEWSPLYTKPIVLQMGVIKTPASLEIGERFQIIFEQLKKIALEYQVEALGFEHLFMNPPKKESDANSTWTRNKSASILDTSMVTGILFLLGSQLGLWTQDYVPGTIKKRVTGNGRASKDLVYECVQQLIPIEFLVKKRQPKDALTPVLRKPEDHESDAVAIGITTIKEYYEYLETKKLTDNEMNE